MSELQRKELGQIRRAAAAVELRMRVARGLAVLPTAVTAALVVSAVTLAVRKALPDALSNKRAWEILIGAAALAVGAIAVAMARRLPPRAGTVALDRHHRLNGRLTNAIAFVDGREARTPLMEVAIDDACEHSAGLDPRRAAPIPLPRDLMGSLAAAAGVAAVALLHVPPKTIAPPPQAKQIDAVQMSPDDIELFRDAAKALEKKDQSPEVKAAVEKFNQLIEDIANKRLDRMEAFRRMEQIERDLLSGQEADAKAFEEALKQTADELKKSDLGKPVGESLEKKDFDKAKKDLKDLAQSLKQSGAKKPDKAAIDKLRKALERAAAKKKEALAALNEKRNELREQLLQKKAQRKDDPDAGAPREDEERLLKKKERELERLDREAERQEAAQRKLDRLDRELAKAAEDLLKDLGLSADDLEQAAEDINRMQEEQMSDKEKEELRQRLQELREQLRQQGQGGKQRMARMLKFGKRARGGKGGQGQQGEGQQGQGQDQEGQDGDEGQDGQGQGGGKDGQGMQPGGPGGQRMLVLQKGSGGSGAPMPGGAGAGQSGQGPGGDGPPGGKGIGTGHDGNVAGKATDLKGSTTDVQGQGADTKQGPSNSEVILTAAERGFKGTGYKKVFTDYHTQAEREINKDTVPDGYRFYVHRYFQLIRPRE